MSAKTGLTLAVVGGFTGLANIAVAKGITGAAATAQKHAPEAYKVAAWWLVGGATAVVSGIIELLAAKQIFHDHGKKSVEVLGLNEPFEYKEGFDKVEKH